MPTNVGKHGNSRVDVNLYACITWNSLRLVSTSLEMIAMHETRSAKVMRRNEERWKRRVTKHIWSSSRPGESTQALEHTMYLDKALRAMQKERLRAKCPHSHHIPSMRPGSCCMYPHAPSLTKPLPRGSRRRIPF